MPEVKVRHAIASWFDDPDDQIPMTAFRGQVVEMPEHEITRLKRHGAVVDPEIELDRPGTLLELPETPTDEELVNWVMNASAAEVQALVDRRPELTGRIEGAAQRITDERKRMDDHLASVRASLRGTTEPVQIDEDLVIGGTPSAGTGEGEPPPPPPPSGEGPTPTSIGELVNGNVADVQAYVRAHPEEAQAVLEAESEVRNGQPRAGVVAAVQAAIASSNL